jgi:hypothetical protein
MTMILPLFICRRSSSVWSVTAIFVAQFERAPSRSAAQERTAVCAGRSPLLLPTLSLLKIQFGAIEGIDKQGAASPILRGSTLIAMMQAADLRQGNNVIACGG